MGRLPALLLSGGCWIGVLATYNTTVQMLVPDWVKARSLALYQTAIFGGLAAGSFMWGHFAGTLGVSGALAGAGVMLGLTVLLLYRSRLPEQVDAQTRADSAEPALQAAGFDTEHGAVLVAVQYQIPNDKLRALIGAAHPLRLMRLRNGAQQWQLFRDLEREGVWREVFLVELDAVPAHAGSHDAGRQDGAGRRARAARRRRGAGSVAQRQLPGDERVAGILAAAGSGIAVGRAARLSRAQAQNVMVAVTVSL